jgi:anti-anti-sigma regulatory factor
MIVELYGMFGTDTLRHRETARKVVELIEKEAKSSETVIDFSKIDFASRSFLHELMCDLGNRKVIFENRNEEVEQMMNIISKSTVCASC